MSDAKTKSCGGEDTPLSVLDYFKADANVLIEGGRLVWLRKDTGFAQTSTYAIANPQNVTCVGECLEHLDNTTGNSFGNSALTGVPGRYQRGIFLCLGDGTVTQSQVSFPVFLVSDATGSNNGAITVSANSNGGARPFVGYVATNPRGATDNPDPSRIPVEIGATGPQLFQPGMLVQSYANDPTLHTAAFSTVPGFMHKISPTSITFAFTFPALSAAIDGMRIAIVNTTTGSTATIATPTGSDNVGNSAGATTGATAAGPTGGATKTYTADNTQKAWIVGV
jgi:hypothetical protein